MKRTLWIGIGLICLWGASSLLTYQIWIHDTYHHDFYPWWAGARLALFEGKDLYAVETTRMMQIRLYGAVFPPEIDQQGFAYPAYLVPLLLPFWLIPNVEVATACWVGLSVILMLSALLLLRQIRGTMPAWWVSLWLFWYFSLLMFYQGQITAFVLASFGIAYWAYQRNRDILSGSMLALGVIKPELVALPALILLLWALRTRRWKMIVSGMTVYVGLFAASLFISGWWVPGWLEAIGRYAQYAKINLPLGTVWKMAPSVAIFLVIFIGLSLFLAKGNPHVFLANSVSIGLLILPQTLIWGLTILTIPLILLWQKQTRFLIFAIWVIGWLSLAGNLYSSQWWLVQSVLMPWLVLSLGVYVSWLEK